MNAQKGFGKQASRSSLVMAILVLSLALKSYAEQEAKVAGNDTAGWPNFRGPNGAAVARSGDFPLSWDAKSGSNILWKAMVPKRGFSSPIVSGRKVFVTGADSAAREVYSFDADSGKLLGQWAVTNIPGSPATQPTVSPDTGHAAPTMATDGERVFAIFANGDVAAFSFDGRQIWGRNVGQAANMYGHASSLIVCGNILLIQFDDMRGGRLIGVDALTGAIAWDKQRKDIRNSWASPILVNTGKRTELILNACPSLCGYDPATGEELWRVDCMNGDVAPSAASAGGLVFVANDYVRCAAVQLGEKPAVVWESREDLPDTASPVASGKFLFLASAGGVVTCLDAKKGTKLWKHAFDAGFVASPVIAADRVYLMDKKGVMRVVAADSEFRLLAESSLDESSVCTPAFVDGRIYLRGNQNVYCIGVK